MESKYCEKIIGMDFNQRRNLTAISYVSTTTCMTPSVKKINVYLMSFCQKLTLPFLTILLLQKLLCVFMALPLSVSMMSKVMRRKW